MLPIVSDTGPLSHVFPVINVYRGLQTTTALSLAPSLAPDRMVLAMVVDEPALPDASVLLGLALATSVRRLVILQMSVEAMAFNRGFHPFQKTQGFPTPRPGMDLPAFHR